MDVISQSIPDKDVKIAEILYALTDAVQNDKLDAIVVFTVLWDRETETFQEEVHSAFDLVLHEAGIAVLERWCAEARKSIELYRTPPGGSA